MIRYSLLCERDHAFESWFRDSAAYDGLERAGQVACPVCESVKVRKALMTPSVVAARKSGKATAPEPSTADATPVPAPMSPPTAPIALLDDRERKVRDMMRALHHEITTKADDVGRGFADEARRIHVGDAPARSIYGEATREQVTSLLEDGVPLLPMPVFPDDHN